MFTSLYFSLLSLCFVNISLKSQKVFPSPNQHNRNSHISLCDSHLENKKEDSDGILEVFLGLGGNLQMLVLFPFPP